MGTTAAIIGLGYSIYSGERANTQQERAQSQAEKQAADTERKAQEAMNRTNPKKPDINALLAAAQQGGKAGISGTMLTGPSGVDPGSMSLGRSTLLGQ